jgi:RNA polymerase sigma-70 factor, ECF subfamily
VSDESENFRAVHARAIARIEKRGGAAQWKLDTAALADVIERGVRAAQIAPGTVEEFIDSLRADDLVLAAACRVGVAGAWAQLIEQYRPRLYAAARAIAGDDARGRELADSLWAELYGLEVREGRRRSLLDYYHGRSSLLTWIRAVLAQRHVDSIREAAKNAPLEAAPEPVAPAADPPEPNRSRHVQMMGKALQDALGALAPRDRMRLAYYYRHELSLKEIGRLMGEHESSVSRKLTRIRDDLKREVERSLTQAGGLSNEQITMCYDWVAGDLKLDLARLLPDKR